MEYEPATVGDATGEWDPLGAVHGAARGAQADLAHEQDATARTALEGRIAELTFAVANPGDRRVLVRNFVERFGFPHGRRARRPPGVGGVDTSAPWRIDFWLGGWDPDLLCLYMKGALNVPTRTVADGPAERSPQGARRAARGRAAAASWTPSRSTSSG